MQPSAALPGWLLGAVAQFDSLSDLADRLVALHAVAVRDGDAAAARQIVELRRRMRELDGRDEASVTAFAAELRKRAAEVAR